MNSLTITPRPEKLDTLISFTEYPLQTETFKCRQRQRDRRLQERALFGWLVALINAIGLGGTPPGRAVNAMKTGGGMAVYLALGVSVALSVTLIKVLGGEKFPAFVFEVAMMAVFAVAALHAAFWYVIHLAGNKFANRDDAEPFRRELMISASQGVIGIASDFEELQRQSSGGRYDLTYIPFNDIVAVEDTNIAQVMPQTTSGPHNRLAVSKTFQISLFTSSGARHVLMYDDCGADYARQFRTRLATMIHTAQTVHGRYQRLQSQNAWDDLARAEACETLYGYAANTQTHPSAPHAQLYPQPQSHRQLNPQHHQPQYANIVPPSERL